MVWGVRWANRDPNDDVPMDVNTLRATDFTVEDLECEDEEGKERREDAGEADDEKSLARTSAFCPLSEPSVLPHVFFGDAGEGGAGKAGLYL